MAARSGRAGRWVRGAVFVLSILCLVAVLWPIAANARQLAATLEGGRMARFIVFGAVVYAALSTLLALAWWWVAGIYGGRPPVRRGYTIWARSQLAKYLPGNAFHYVSRQVLGVGAGLSHPALVASGFLEMGSLLLAALLAGAVAMSQAREALWGGLSWPLVVVVAVGCLLAWPAADVLLRRHSRSARFMADLPHLSSLETLRLLGPAVLLHTLFFLGTGGLLLALVRAGGAPPARPWAVLGFYPVAWMAGTVSLGAPAGAGVREAVLTLQLGPQLGAAQAAVAALALRLVTLGGDLLTALAGWWLEAASAQNSEGGTP